MSSGSSEGGEEGKGSNSRPQQQQRQKGAKEEHELEFASRTRETPEEGREVKIGGSDKKKATASEPAAGESPGREQQR